MHDIITFANLCFVNIRRISQCFQKTHSHNQFSRSLHFQHPKCLYMWIEVKALFSKIISSEASFIILSRAKHVQHQRLPQGQQGKHDRLFAINLSSLVDVHPDIIALLVSRQSIDLLCEECHLACYRFVFLVPVLGVNECFFR